MLRRARWEYLRKIHPRYRRGSHEEKSRILDEFCKVAGYNRKYAIGLLSGPPPEPRLEEDGRSRRPTYLARTIIVLMAIWEAAGYPWSVRLVALLPLWLPWARKRFSISAVVEKQLLTISARQIDRRLQAHKRRAKKRLYGRTKPGTLLKHHIPIKTDSWDVKTPGHCEIDLVSHSGDTASGEFLHSLTVTDIHTTWSEMRVVMGKGQFGVQQALEDIRSVMPFPLRAIDSDNGSEFINQHLLRYCKRKGIQFTRGRPYKKDDNAHVEQKNWTHVRKLLGYLRYDSEEALRAINRLYRGDLRLLQNLFLPGVKLVRKERVGAKLRRRYDRARTPLDRVLESTDANQDVVAKLDALREGLDPFLLSQSVDRQLAGIHALSNVRYNPKSAGRAAKTTEARAVTK
jgi:hypothetical protein